MYKKKKKKSNAGRPTVMTKQVLAELKGAFSMGHTDEEACLLADIDMASLYRYCQKNPDFAIQKEHLKHTPTLVARQNIMVAIQKADVGTSKWFLERKTEEFREKRDTDITSDGEKIRGIILTEGSDDTTDNTPGKDKA